MFDSGLIDVALSLFALFALLSLFCTAIGEAIASLFLMRARYLANGIADIIKDPIIREGLYSHPFISSLAKEAGSQYMISLLGNRCWRQGLRVFPSYIPPESFAKALIDAIAPGMASIPESSKVQYLKAAVEEVARKGASPLSSPEGTEALSKELRMRATKQKLEADAAVAESTRLMQAIDTENPATETAAKDAEAESLRVRQLADDTAAIADMAETLANAYFTSGLNKVENKTSEARQVADVAKAVLTAIGAGGENMEKVREGIAVWYENAMARIAGRYKRGAQTVLFALGLIMAVVLNADAIRIAEVLSKDPNLQKEVAKKVSEYEPKLQARIVATEATPPAEEEAGAQAAAFTEEQLENMKLMLSELQLLGMPLGWDDPQSCAYFRDHWKMCFLGWILSAFAISLGAPFWFDALGKVMAIRGTGALPPKSAPRA